MPKKLSLNELIEKSKEIHGENYSYDKFILINSHTKGIITCPIHGDFEQSFDVHIHQKSAALNALTLKEIIRIESLQIQC